MRRGVAVLIVAGAWLAACKDTHVGALCKSNAECPSGPCLDIGRCSESCNADSDCIPGWWCGAYTGVAEKYCQCTPSTESCDGRDNDCDTKVDNGATCPMGQACQHGQCPCVGALCGTQCVDLSNTLADCGACGHACAAHETCSNGACQCPLDVCGGACLDTSADPANCGACGHDCLGGDCVFGQCRPVELATVPFLQALQVQPPYVYGLTHTTVIRVDSGAAAGVSPAQIAGGFTLAWSFAVDATAVYVADHSAQKIFMAPIAGTTAAPTALVSDAGQATTLIADATHLYWTGSDKSIRRAGLDGSGPITVANHLLQADPSLQLDAANLYWFDDLAIFAAPLAALPASGARIASVTYTPQLVLYGGYLYFDIQGGMLSRLPVAGGTPTTIIPSVAIQYLGVDGSGVYYNSSVALNRVPLAGGAPTELARMNDTIVAFGFDDTAVYYVTQSPSEMGTLLRLAK